MTDAEKAEERGAGESKMDIKVLNQTNNETVFTLDGINPGIANTIRRLAMSEVNCLAIEDVHITSNSSALYDEVLAHRIGLIPLKTDLKSYNRMDECKCKGKGCAHCQVKFTLKAKGPCTVYASDLQSKDKEITPVHPNIPIVYLLKDQEVELDATAVLNNGKDHTKHQPGLIYYYGYPEGKSDAQVLKMENKDIENCSDKKFVFHVEPWGQLTAKEILSESIKIMDEKLNQFEKLVKKAK